MRSVKVTLAVGLALLAAVGALTLTRSPPRVVRVGVPANANASLLTDAGGDIAMCQSGEVLPAGVSDIRLALWSYYGAKVHVRVYSGSRVIAAGSRGPDWTSDSVTVPVKPLNRSTSGVTLCFAVGPSSQPVLLRGVATPGKDSAVAEEGTSSPTPRAAAGAGRGLQAKLGVEYLASGRGSWWSRVSSVAMRMGLGRAYSGTWIAFLVAALMGIVGVLAIRLTLRELR
jgi:hypothetical protein